MKRAPTPRPGTGGKGPLIVIGGREERESHEERKILREVVRLGCRTSGKLLIVTAATSIPEDVAQAYITTFEDLGAKGVELLDIRTREDAFDEANLQKLDDAGCIFFTGGDQLRITSQIGGTPVFRRMLEIHDAGGVIAGTSAGAAAVPETMLISGSSEASLRVDKLGMAPGLGVLRGVVIDSHFAERGRIGRLLAAVAQNPYNLGIGIDEDTAFIVEEETRGRVMGSGAVYVIDGRRVSYSSLSERHPEGIVSVHDLTLHMLCDREEYDLFERRPIPPAGARRTTVRAPRRGGTGAKSHRSG